MKNKTIIFYDLEATSVSRDADMVSIGLVAVTEVPEGHILLTEIEDNVFSWEWSDIDIKTFYAEFTGFDMNKCDNWVKENVVKKLYLQNSMKLSANDVANRYYKTFVLGYQNFISKQLKQWLSQFESVEFWADFDVIDKPMLIDLIADWDTKEIQVDLIQNKCVSFDCTCKDYYETNAKIGLPKHLPNIKYDQFFDLHTLFKIKGVDTDINREEFIGNLIKQIPEGNKHNALYDCYVAWKCYDKLMSI